MDKHIKLGRYKHFKGKEYKLLYIARHSETMEFMAVYQALYGDFGIWVRPLTMFSEEVDVNRERTKRFTFIGD